MNSTSNSASNTPPVESLPRAVYEKRCESFIRQAEALGVVERRFVRVRITTFLSAILLGVICLGNASVSFWWLLIPALVFAALVPLHNKCVEELQRCQRVLKFYQECISRIDGKWSDRSQCGSQFIDTNHPWVVDLDVFGQGSLFQLMTECRTGPGLKRLAAWMQSTASSTEIAIRQTRSSALKEELDLRESLAMVNDTVDWSTAEALLHEWVNAPPQRIPLWIRICSAAIGVIAIPVVTAVLMGWLPFSALVLLLILQSPLIMATRKQIHLVSSTMDSVDLALHQLAEVLVLFERHSFADPTLRDLQCRLSTDGAAASDSIRQLSSLTRWRNHALRNQFFAPIAWMGGLIVLLTDRLEHWRESHGSDVALWLDTTSEFEALVSVAAFRFEHPDYANPTVIDDHPIYDAQQLGHPLLAQAECIRNDVKLSAERPLMLISGSNMSGKSTLLRSVGTNLILTFCGACVNAASLRTYPFQLATAMRISDSLQEGRSLFFSVVQRLKAVVDLTLKERTVLFLLDEILNGTNSHDRRRGAEAVIRSLVDRGGLGIVTTHDLALTQIVDSMNGRAVNKHFEDTITDGKMLFDYQLRDGVVQRSNALELMRMLGLDV
ncbi:MAG: hypothetical protein KDA91_17915 [Planctomycetaceae bacterium]|nr:hypothetical protein [Planctomycetaceae bacterium]